MGDGVTTRRGIVAVAAMLVGGAVIAAAQASPDLRALYEAHDWFALRDAVAHGQPPLFYQGVVEAAFNDAANAERDLKVVIQSDPGGADAVAARRQLLALAFRAGRYLDADQQLERLLDQRPDASLSNGAPLLRVLARTPDQEVVERRNGSGRLDIVDGNILLPVRINGQAAEFIFDTGSNLSVVSESEAARLGLDVRTVETSIGGTARKGVQTRVAAGVPLVVANIRVANVAFLVLPDSQPPFSGLPPGRRGVVGLPVLLAMRTLQWRAADQAFDCGFESGAFEVSRATVAFDELVPITQVAVRDRLAGVTLDTGAQATDFYPPFAAAFADLLRTARPTSHDLTGFDGTTTVVSATIPSLPVRVGGFQSTITDANVITAEGGRERRVLGNLGMDVLNQARETTIDFGRMALTLK